MEEEAEEEEALSGLLRTFGSDIDTWNQGRLVSDRWQDKPDVATKRRGLNDSLPMLSPREVDGTRWSARIDADHWSCLGYW